MGQSGLMGTKKSGNGSEAEGGLKRRARRATVAATKRPMQSGKRRTGRTGQFSSYIYGYVHLVTLQCSEDFELICIHLSWMTDKVTFEMALLGFQVLISSRPV